jgi:5-methylcytosine-specific restriction enzyme subunit McrC
VDTRTLTLVEYGEVEFAWDARDLAAIAHANRLSGVEVLRAGVNGVRKVLQARQYVGVLRLAGSRPYTVQILPRIVQRDASASLDAQAHAATHNLLHMLAYAGAFPLHELELAPLLARELDWLEILTHLFAAHLAAEWRRGAPGQFHEVEAEHPVLKGKWRVEAQAHRPAPQTRMGFAVRYAEFSADNALNRVLRYVVEQLWRVTRDDDNRRRLGDLRAWMDEAGVTLLPTLSAADAVPGLITRLNRRFEPLLNLARLFLSHSALQLAAGQVQAYSLVFDMNLLFQEFIIGFIASHRREILPPHLLHCDLLPQGRGAVQHLARRSAAGGAPGAAVFPLYPDLAFRDGARCVLLLDAKYKWLNAAMSSQQASVHSDDFYQMFIYAQRYQCPRVLLLYPRAAGSPLVRQSFELEGSSGVIEAANVGVQIDLRTQRAALLAELRSILEQV